MLWDADCRCREIEYIQKCSQNIIQPVKRAEPGWLAVNEIFDDLVKKKNNKVMSFDEIRFFFPISKEAEMKQNNQELEYDLFKFSAQCFTN